jgi:RNA polymerase sigma factor (sigma-70 family)
MPTNRAGNGLGRLRAALLPADGGPLPDAQLLAQFLARRDGAAFAALVRRHGPMVLGVCRRVLGHPQDAEDAFQATFLVLARRAGSVRGGEALGGWLYRVALRAARAAGARRRSRERQVEHMPHPEVTPNAPGEDLTAVLDRELDRLPEKYRLPVVLCELEGRPRREVARQLGLPKGTLSSRLAAARKMLARRLRPYGPAASAAALGSLLAGSASAALPGPLVVSTVKAAAGAVPGRVAALAEGVVKAMFLAKLKVSAGVFLLAASVSAGAVGLTYRTATAQAPRAPAAQSVRDEMEALRLEVEALRKGQQALRERVRELEVGRQTQEAQALRERLQAELQARDQVVAQQLPAERERAAAEERVRFLSRVQAAPEASRVTVRWRALAAPVEEAEAALRKLREAPGDKEALAKLEGAVRRLKEAGTKASGAPAQPAKP